jgi:2-polyprenyl-3-methyl-5-hydroxy-6-metoxy-1,4-benzoquinol methylase
LFSECTRCGYALVEGGAEARYWDEAEPTPYWSTAKSDYFTEALDLLASLSGGSGRLLDLGGGIGFFADLALERGWDATSFDIDERATAHAASRLGPDRAWSVLPEDAEGTFDAVTIWCVVAHTLNPHLLLDSARKALRPGGVVWITTPNFAFQKKYGAIRLRAGKPLPFLTDDHLGQFTPTALRELVGRHAFTDPTYHYVGITEQCSLNMGASTPLLRGKRAWNAAALTAMRAGLPNLTSELQLTARLPLAT